MRVDEVEIESPCDEDLDRMELDPTGVERHCARCRKSVHDLSALGPERARTLLAGREPICISYWSNDLGEVLFERAPARPRKSDFVPLTRLARAASLVATLSACTPHGDPLDEHRYPAPTHEPSDESVVQPAAEPRPEPAPEEPCEPELELQPELELELELEPAPVPPDPKVHAIKGKRKTAGVRRPNPLGDL